jgi:hypothetical protein
LLFTGKIGIFGAVLAGDHGKLRRHGFMKIKGFLLILLSFFLVSCGGGPDTEEQAKTFLTLLQNKQFDKCVGLDYIYQVKMSRISDEPQFKQLELAAKIRADTQDEFFDENKQRSIAYLFRFPCTWQLLETKEATSDAAGAPLPVYRVYAVVKYNSMDQSPDAVPLLLKPEAINYNNYKVKEITFHLDLDQDTGLYIGWGTDKHVPW